MAKNDFQYGRWIYLTPCNVPRSWHWFCQVTCTLQCGCGSGIVTVNSPSGSTLQCDTWNAIEFARWQHPAMWQMALGWHAIETSTILELYIWFRFRPHHHQSPKFCPNRTTLGRKKMMSCRFSRWRISAILGFRDPIMGSLKSPCTTSRRSSIDTIALNCLVFEKIALFPFWRQTDEQMDSTDALSRSRCCKQRLNKHTIRLYACRTSVPSTPRLHLSAMGCLAVHWW